MALAPSVRARPLELQRRVAQARATAIQLGQDIPVAQQLALAVDHPKQTRVAPHELDGRYTRAAWLLPAELHQDRWTHATREAYLAAAKNRPPPRGEAYASGVAACLAHEAETPLVHAAPEGEVVAGRGGFVGLRPSVRPTLRSRPQSARGEAWFGRPQLLQTHAREAGADAGRATSVRDRTLWGMAGLETRHVAPAGGTRPPGPVLLFDCAFEHFPIDAPHPVRTLATLYYYTEDDSIQINLPRAAGANQPNEFGDRRGCVFLKRARVLKRDGSLAVRLDRDLNVGSTVEIHARRFEIVGCDANTRAVLSRLHPAVPEDAPAPSSEKAGWARTGDEARRGVGVPVPRPGLEFAFGMQGSRHLHTGRPRARAASAELSSY